MTNGVTIKRIRIVLAMIAPHHGNPHEMCKNSSPFCKIPTGLYPPRPMDAKVGSSVDATCSVTVASDVSGIDGIAGIAGISGIIGDAGIDSIVAVDAFDTAVALVSVRAEP